MNLNLKYESYTGITKCFFPEIKAEIKNNLITVESDGLKKTIKVVYKPITYEKDYIYQLKKTQLNLLKNDGIKFLIEAQGKQSAFFTIARNLMLSILKA